MDSGIFDADAVEPAAAGRASVDCSLVAVTLSLTPEERLRQNDRVLRTIKELRDAIAARRSDDPAGEARTVGR